MFLFFCFRLQQCQTSVDTAQSETPQASAKSSTQQLLNQSHQQQQQQQQQSNQHANNINRKLNGFLNFKTPLIGG